MESNIHSNFIPHDTLNSGSSRTRYDRGMYDLFTLLAIVLFVASATLAVGVFLYLQYLNGSSRSKIEQLERAKAAFEPALIQELTRLDDRMRSADIILSNHVAPTALFALLQQLTLQTVSFSNFSLSFAPGGEIALKMQGLANSVNAIALQADYLSRSGAIQSPVFSNINRQREGVRFDFEANVNPAALGYRNALLGVPTPQAAPAQDGTGQPQAPQDQTQEQTQQQTQQQPTEAPSPFGGPPTQ